MNNQLIAHRGAQVVTREQLRAIPTPAGTWSHKPVPHAELVDVITDQLDRRGLRIGSESLAVSANGMQLFGVFNIARADEPHGEWGRALGFRQANDKSLAIQFVAGLRVFVCDNLALSGEATILKRKHTRSLSLSYEVGIGLDRYFRAAARFEASVQVAQSRVLSDEQAKVLIFDAVYQGIIPNSLFDEVARNYFKAEQLGYEDSAPRTAWGLHNAATRAVKALTPASAFKTTVALGRYFGLGSQLALPAAA